MDIKNWPMSEVALKSLIIEKLLNGETETLVIRDLISAGYPESFSEGQVVKIRKSMSEVIVM